MKRSLLILIVLLVTVLSVACSACSYMPCPPVDYDSMEELQQAHPEFYYFDDFDIEVKFSVFSAHTDDKILQGYPEWSDGPDYSSFHYYGYTVGGVPLIYSEPETAHSLYIRSYEVSQTAFITPSYVTNFTEKVVIDGIEFSAGTIYFNEMRGVNLVNAYYIELKCEIEEICYVFTLLKTRNDSTDDEPFDPDYTVDDFIEMVTPAIINRHKGDV